MNAEHQALAEYLMEHFNKRLKNQSKDLYKHMDKRFDNIDADLKEVNRRIDSQIVFVDNKNAEQDEDIESHETRIRVLESGYRILTS